jgi:hypothetical protein
MKRAWDDLTEKRAVNRTQRREEARLVMERVLDECMATGDYRHAILAIDRLSKLDGLDQPATVRYELSGAMALAGETDPEKARGLLEELRAKQDPDKPTAG